VTEVKRQLLEIVRAQRDELHSNLVTLLDKLGREATCAGCGCVVWHIPTDQGVVTAQDSGALHECPDE